MGNVRSAEANFEEKKGESSAQKSTADEFSAMGNVMGNVRSAEANFEEKKGESSAQKSTADEFSAKSKKKRKNGDDNL